VIPVTGTRSAKIAAVMIMVLLASGCTVFDGKEQLGTLLTSWSQGDYADIETVAPKGTLVLADDADRDAFLAGVLDEGVDTDPVARADLRHSFLVLGAYAKCMQQSRVWMDDRRTAVWFEDYVAREDRNTACAWSPITIDIWQLPRSDLGEVDAADLSAVEPQ